MALSKTQLESEIEKIVLPFRQYLDKLEDRIDLLERVFKKICEFDSRLDTLEFNSNLPVKPSISEMLLDLRLRVEKLETT